MESTNELFDDDTVVLTLEDGSELECQIAAIFPANNKRYIALMAPVEGEEDELLFYGYEEAEDGEPILINIEDEDEYEIVMDAFEELLDEMEFEELNSDEE